MSFNQFSQAVRTKWETMVKNNEVFQLDVEKDVLWDLYLASFPEGTNPIYIERTEHDCNCCKQFIRNIGRAVTIGGDGKLDSVWNLEGLPYPYDVVAAQLHAVAQTHQINTIYRTVEKEFGKEVTYQLPTEDGATARMITWNHFSGKTGKVQSATTGKEMGQHQTNVGVFRRGLEELTPEAFQTVLDLIQADNLYKGAEWKQRLQDFAKTQQLYNKGDNKQKLYMLHTHVNKSFALIRNTSMGTLLIDLSEGKPLEAAVKSYEDKVSGTNYKRPKALLTPKMIEQANETLISLGLGEAIMRRHATIEDVSINNVLWADGTAKKLMQGNGLMDLLGSHVKPAKKPALTGGVVDIAIQEFLDTVLPEAVTMDLMFDNSHVGNLVSITAPQVPESGKLFKWDNGFAWSYAGNITDSVLRQQVQERGGSVTGAFRFSHSWNHPGMRNTSLMDLHVFLPANNRAKKLGKCDTYGNNERVGWNNRNHGATGGTQDVDYTGAAELDYIPVENITFPDLARMPNGDYECQIHNWNKRTHSTGFHAEIEFNNQVFSYEYDKAMGEKEWVPVATVTKKGDTFSIQHHLPHGETTKQKWGLETKQFVRVQTVMLSPNFWDGKQIGNQHYFFLLEGAKNDEPTRGIYNEFLTPELEKHRKVFEVLGDKAIIQPSDQQLSGVGFSSTKRAEFVIRVKTKNSQITYNVKV